MKAIEVFFNEALPYPRGVNNQNEVVAYETAGQLYGYRAVACLLEDGTMLLSSVAPDGMSYGENDEGEDYSEQRKMEDKARNDLLAKFRKEFNLDGAFPSVVDWRHIDPTRSGAPKVGDHIVAAGQDWTAKGWTVVFIDGRAPGDVAFYLSPLSK